MLRTRSADTSQSQRSWISIATDGSITPGAEWTSAGKADERGSDSTGPKPRKLPGVSSTQRGSMAPVGRRDV